MMGQLAGIQKVNMVGKITQRSHSYNGSCRFPTQSLPHAGKSINMNCTLLLCNFCQTGMCCQLSVKLPNIKFLENPFGKYITEDLKAELTKTVLIQSFHGN
jgi:hypothetical protein